jgi:hypothetical protein
MVANGKFCSIITPRYGPAGRMCVAAVVLLLAGCLLAHAGSSSGNSGTGPLNMPSLSPGNLFRPAGYIASPSYAPEGSWVLLTSLSWVNTWNVEQDHFMIDGEWLHLAARVSYMLTEDVELGAYIPFLGRTGGFTDGFIEDFHNTFGLGNARREGYPRNQSIVDIRSPEGQHARWEGDQWGLSDVSLFASWTLTQGGRFVPGIIVGGVATLPTGDKDKLLGSGKPVFGVSALLTKRIETTPWLLFLGTAASYSDNDEMVGIDTRKTQFAALGGLEYEWSDRVSFIVQNLTTSPIADDYYEFSEPTYELNVGLRIRDGFRGEWEIGFQENLFYFNNSSDVGMHVAYRRVL